jgi:hypothetical protein
LTHIAEESCKTLVQLPLWPDLVRGAPNALLRSAFFAGIHSKKRKELGIRIKPDEPKKSVPVAAQNGIRIEYAGDQLNQYDADVFLEALHRAQGEPLGTECQFRGYDFLKAIGRCVGKREYEDLNNSLTRLRDGRVVVKWEINGRAYSFTGGLIASYIREETTKLYKIIFSAEIKKLFARSCWTQLEWQERQALKRHPLAQWLHSYFSTHAQPLPVSVAFLHEKSGSPTALLKHFRVELKNALAFVERTLGWKVAWDGGLVTVTHPPSGPQARYLLRHAGKEPTRNPHREKEGLTAIGDMLPGLLKGI